MGFRAASTTSQAVARSDERPNLPPRVDAVDFAVDLRSIASRFASISFPSGLTLDNLAAALLASRLGRAQSWPTDRFCTARRGPTRALLAVTAY